MNTSVTGSCEGHYLKIDNTCSVLSQEALESTQYHSLLSMAPGSKLTLLRTSFLSLPSASGR